MTQTPFIWPFRSKVGTAQGPIGANDTQWRRVDQGQDLQGVTGSEEDCLAIAPGTVTMRCDPGNDGRHFGCPYAVLFLDKPIDGVTAIYYGHTHPTVPEGTHLATGDVIAVTTSPGGGGAPDHWLEIGPWTWHPTGNGQQMHNWLVDAPVYGEETDDMTPEEHETLQQAHDAIARMEGVLNNVVGAVADIQSRVGNVVQPDVEAIKQHEGA